MQLGMEQSRSRSAPSTFLLGHDARVVRCPMFQRTMPSTPIRSSVGVARQVSICDSFALPVPVFSAWHRTPPCLLSPCSAPVRTAPRFLCVGQSGGTVLSGAVRRRAARSVEATRMDTYVCDQVQHNCDTSSVSLGGQAGRWRCYNRPKWLEMDADSRQDGPSYPFKQTLKRGEIVLL